jgi:hypothetical protein
LESLNANSLHPAAKPVKEPQARVTGSLDTKAIRLPSGDHPGRTEEADRDGKVLFSMDVERATVYRSFRVDDMYSAPVNK